MPVAAVVTRASIGVWDTFRPKHFRVTPLLDPMLLGQPLFFKNIFGDTPINTVAFGIVRQFALLPLLRFNFRVGYRAARVRNLRKLMAHPYTANMRRVAARHRDAP